MPRRFRWAAGLLAIAVSGAALAQNSVRLRFAWPDELVAQVQTQKSKSRQVGDEPAAANSAGSEHVMRVQRQGDGYLVSTSNVRMDSTKLASMTPEQRAFLELAAKASPSYRVSKDGGFVGIDKLPELQAAIRTLMQTLFPDSPMRERIRPVVEMVTSEAVLTNLASSDWNWMVGTWTGGESDLDVGDAYEVTTQSPTVIPNVQLTQHLRFSVARKLPCERAGSTRECVELRATLKPDATQIRKIVADFLGKLAPADAAKISRELAALNQETTLELVTETATLIPHRYKLRKTSIVSGQSQPLRQVEETEQLFLYPKSD